MPAELLYTALAAVQTHRYNHLMSYHVFGSRSILKTDNSLEVTFIRIFLAQYLPPTNGGGP